MYIYTFIHIHTYVHTYLEIERKRDRTTRIVRMRLELSATALCFRNACISYATQEWTNRTLAVHKRVDVYDARIWARGKRRGCSLAAGKYPYSRRPISKQTGARQAEGLQPCTTHAYMWHDSLIWVNISKSQQPCSQPRAAGVGPEFPRISASFSAHLFAFVWRSDVSHQKSEIGHWSAHSSAHSSAISEWGDVWS